MCCGGVEDDQVQVSFTHNASREVVQGLGVRYNDILTVAWA